MLYTSYGHPILDYASVLWDPYQKNVIYLRERAQNRAARYIVGDYRRTSSVTAMKTRLQLQTLSDRRRYLRLKFFHNIFHGRSGIDKTSYMLTPHYISNRRDHAFKVRQTTSRGNLLKYSFCRRRASEWNRLPENEDVEDGEPVATSTACWRIISIQ